MLQPAWKDHQLVGLGRDIGDRPGFRFAERIGKTAESELAAAEAARRLGKIINAGQNSYALDPFQCIDVGLEIAAIAIASEFEFPRLDLRLRSGQSVPMRRARSHA